jgi:hypothetical protein
MPTTKWLLNAGNSHYASAYWHFIVIGLFVGLAGG